MDSNSKGKKQVSRANILEAFKDISTSTGEQIKNDLFKESGRDIVNQIFGRIPKPHYTGEIMAGEQLVMSEVFSGKREEDERVNKQLFVEKTLLNEEKQLVEKKSKELSLKIHAILSEVERLAEATPKIMNEIEAAAIIAPVNPGPYHIIFFEKILEFIVSFRKKVENASIWLATANKRAQKKGYWASYKKHGGKFLLSAEHYLQRSAG